MDPNPSLGNKSSQTFDLLVHKVLHRSKMDGHYSEKPTYLSPSTMRDDLEIKQLHVYHIHCKSMTSQLERQLLLRTTSCSFFRYVPNFPDEFPPVIQPPHTYVFFGVFAALPWFIAPKATHTANVKELVDETLLLDDLPDMLQQSITDIPKSTFNFCQNIANENVAIYAFCYHQMLHMYSPGNYIEGNNVFQWKPEYGYVFNHTDNILHYREKRLNEMKANDEFGELRKSKKINRQFQALGFFPAWVEARMEMERSKESQFLGEDINNMFSNYHTVKSIEKELWSMNGPISLEHKIYKAWLLVKLLKQIGIEPYPFLNVLGSTSDPSKNEDEKLNDEVPSQVKFDTNKIQLEQPIEYGDPRENIVAKEKGDDMDWYTNPQAGWMKTPFRVRPYLPKIDSAHPNSVPPDKLITLTPDEKLVVYARQFDVPNVVETSDYVELQYMAVDMIRYPQGNAGTLETQLHGYLEDHVGSISLGEQNHDRCGFHYVHESNDDYEKNGFESIILILPNGSVWTISYNSPDVANKLANKLARDIENKAPSQKKAKQMLKKSMIGQIEFDSKNDEDHVSTKKTAKSPEEQSKNPYSSRAEERKRKSEDEPMFVLGKADLKNDQIND